MGLLIYLINFDRDHCGTSHEKIIGYNRRVNLFWRFDIILAGPHHLGKRSGAPFDLACPLAVEHFIGGAVVSTTLEVGQEFAKLH